MSKETTRVRMTFVQEIQLLYSTEPDWSEVDNETLAALVEDFVSEPSSVTTALGLLARRQDRRANTLAHWLLVYEQADQWLQAAARCTPLRVSRRKNGRSMSSNQSERFA
jgi:hypothetical protein